MLLECACPSGPIAQPFLKLTKNRTKTWVYSLSSFSFQPSSWLTPGWCRTSAILLSFSPFFTPSNDSLESCACLTESSSLPCSWVLGWQHYNPELVNSIPNPDNELFTLQPLKKQKQNKRKRVTVSSAFLLGLLFYFGANGNVEVKGKYGNMSIGRETRNHSSWFSFCS